MIAGCYSLHLYCDNERCPDRYPDGAYKHNPQGDYSHELGSVCRQRARRAGWLLGRERTLCPLCSGKGVSSPA